MGLNVKHFIPTGKIPRTLEAGQWDQTPLTGAKRHVRAWALPADSRVKSGKYIKKRDGADK